jgi:hypothetical protein
MKGESRAQGPAHAAAPIPRTTPRIADWLARATHATDPFWKSPADQALTALIDSGRPFTVHQLPDMGVPSPHHSSQWGALIAGAQRAGRIESLGATISCGRLVRVWQRIDR